MPRPRREGPSCHQHLLRRGPPPDLRWALLRAKAGSTWCRASRAGGADAQTAWRSSASRPGDRHAHAGDRAQREPEEFVDVERFRQMKAAESFAIRRRGADILRLEIPESSSPSRSPTCARSARDHRSVLLRRGHPAVLIMGCRRGFGSGLGIIATPLVALAVPRRRPRPSCCPSPRDGRDGLLAYRGTFHAPTSDCCFPAASRHRAGALTFRYFSER